MPVQINITVISWFRRHTLAAHLLVIALAVLLYSLWPVAAFLVVSLYVVVLGVASMNMATNLFVDTLRHVHPDGAHPARQAGRLPSVSMTVPPQVLRRSWPYSKRMM